MNIIKIAELFSGAGGFTASVDNIFQPTVAIDNDPRAYQVYTKNRPHIQFINKDATQIKNFSTFLGNKPDMILAGPPCQGFSIVGMKTKKNLSALRGYNPATDPRNFLALEIPRIAALIKPKTIIMENVPAMQKQYVNLNGDNFLLTDILRRQLEETGYLVSEPFILNSQDLGIAQNRKRTFIVASIEAKFLESEIRTIVERSKKLDRPLNLEDAIGDLVSQPVSTRRAKIVGGIPDHISREPNLDDLRIIQNLRQGEDYGRLVQRMPEVLEGRKHKIYKTTSFKDKFFRMRWGRPSRAIVAHLQKDGNSYIHPILNRSISVREAARIQSFSDKFVFDVPMSPAYRLIGNAVPPLMGKFLVEIFSMMTGLLNEKTAESLQFAGLVS